MTAHDRYQDELARLSNKRAMMTAEYRAALVKAENEIKLQFADIRRQADEEYNAGAEKAYKRYLAGYDAEQARERVYRRLGLR